MHELGENNDNAMVSHGSNKASVFSSGNHNYIHHMQSLVANMILNLK